MIQVLDQVGRLIQLQVYPKRIISVVPSQTELLFDLGLTEEVVGITKFCVHPEAWFRQKTKVGGTKTLKLDVIHSLNPDLIIANKEENTQEQIEVLAQQYPVWISDVVDLQSAYEMIKSIGSLTNKIEKAGEIISVIQKDFTTIQNEKQSTDPKPRTAYLIWKDPYMTVGGDTFINEMLKACGLQNVYDHLTRYPLISIDDLQQANCQILLLSSEPYPFTEKHIAELNTKLPGTKILLADGEILSWYGSRLLHAAPYFKMLLERSRLVHGS